MQGPYLLQGAVHTFPFMCSIVYNMCNLTELLLNCRQIGKDKATLVTILTLASKQTINQSSQLSSRRTNEKEIDFPGTAIRTKTVKYLPHILGDEEDRYTVKKHFGIKCQAFVRLCR